MYIKNLSLLIILLSMLVACKKEKTLPVIIQNNSSKTDTTLSNLPFISSIDCSSSQSTRTLFQYEEVSSISFKLNYEGGNGKIYMSQTINSSGVLGLTAKLESDTLALGNGSLTFKISGTPTSIGKATFEIIFCDRKCSQSFTIEENPSSKINFSSVGESIGSFQENIKDIDGNSYKTVKIGGQLWMAENLKVTKYNDGTVLNIVNREIWEGYYKNDPIYDLKFGKLYTWWVINSDTKKNICPIGWHIPSKEEWTTLIDYLGGEDLAGGKMKEVGTSSWISPNSEATNSSLFTGLPGGHGYDGDYSDDIGENGIWWSTTVEDQNQFSSFPIILFLNKANGKSVFSTTFTETYGFSIRCLKD